MTTSCEKLEKSYSSRSTFEIFKYSLLVILACPRIVECGAWDEWWAYDGISGKLIACIKELPVAFI